MRDVSRHKSLDVLQAFMRDADLFRDHAGAGLRQCFVERTDYDGALAYCQIRQVRLPDYLRAQPAPRFVAPAMRVGLPHGAALL